MREDQLTRNDDFRMFFGAIAFAFSLLFVSSCGSPPVSPAPEIPPDPPALVKAPHPAGTDLGDLRALLARPESPKQDELGKCDADYQALVKQTDSFDELRKGGQELVRRDPVRYHWCFYGKTLSVEERLADVPLISDRQKLLVSTYRFLTFVARGFEREFRDSRYLRFAIHRYRLLSERHFFRTVEMTPETTSRLVKIENPFGLWRQPDGAEEGVLSKYGVSPGTPSGIAAPATTEATPRAAAPTETVAPAESVTPAEPVTPSAVQGGAPPIEVAP